MNYLKTPVSACLECLQAAAAAAVVAVVTTSSRRPGEEVTGPEEEAEATTMDPTLTLTAQEHAEILYYLLHQDPYSSSTLPAFIHLLNSRLALPPLTSLIALLYIHRLPNTHQLSPYYIYLTALILASKWAMDHPYTNRGWSRASGVEQALLDKMEAAFLGRLGWRLHVTVEEWGQWVRFLRMVRDMLREVRERRELMWRKQLPEAAEREDEGKLQNQEGDDEVRGEAAEGARAGVAVLVTPPVTPTMDKEMAFKSSKASPSRPPPPEKPPEPHSGTLTITAPAYQPLTKPPCFKPPATKRLRTGGIHQISVRDLLS